MRIKITIMEFERRLQKKDLESLAAHFIIPTKLQPDGKIIHAVASAKYVLWNLTKQSKISKFHELKTEQPSRYSLLVRNLYTAYRAGVFNI